MTDDIPARICPSCRGSSVQDGKLGVHLQTFRPQGRWMFAGDTLKAYVCLDCGFVGQYLNDVDLYEIKNR